METIYYLGFVSSVVVKVLCFTRQYDCKHNIELLPTHVIATGAVCYLSHWSVVEIDP